MLSRIAVVSNIFLPGIQIRKVQYSNTFSEYISVKMHGELMNSCIMISGFSNQYCAFHYGVAIATVTDYEIRAVIRFFFASDDTCAYIYKKLVAEYGSLSISSVMVLNGGITF